MSVSYKRKNANVTNVINVTLFSINKKGRFFFSFMFFRSFQRGLVSYNSQKKANSYSIFVGIMFVLIKRRLARFLKHIYKAFP